MCIRNLGFFQTSGFVLAALVATSLRADIVSIDFEHLPGPDGVLGTADDVPTTPDLIISDEFLSANVRFILDPAFPDHTNRLRDWAPFDSIALTTLYPQGDGRSGRIRGEFVEPVSSITARIGWFDSPPGGNRLYALAADGTILGFADTTASNQLVTIESTEPIWAFVVDGRLTAPTYAVLDDLSFNVIPAPASLAAVGAMGVMVGGRRRRR